MICSYNIARAAITPDSRLHQLFTPDCAPVRPLCSHASAFPQDDQDGTEVEWFRYAPPKIGVDTLDVPLFEAGAVHLKTVDDGMTSSIAGNTCVMASQFECCVANARAYEEVSPTKSKAWTLMSLLSGDSEIVRKIAAYYHGLGDYQMTSYIKAVFQVSGYMHDVKVYADCLYAWGFLVLRLELLKRCKFVSEIELTSVGLTIGELCHRCGAVPEAGGEFCKACKTFVSCCAICHERVKGAAMGCLDCR